MDEQASYEAGTAMRRLVLGDAHVDRSIANRTPLTAEFQQLLTRYAWGEIWTRPGLDVRSRRLLVIGTLVALGRCEEFRMHTKAALTNEAGRLSMDDVKEVVLQQAIYCGIPAANRAFDLLREIEADGA